ncbi:MAG: peptidoglycan DD-metalloendopeptidase family protein [Cyanobacteria bacterium]|nr:peptidoglycan DD-metalloendopeptidase family protein [Cyanobacteriota bacterium]MDA1020528.1 peptidoglycan DD-metalloendopeptidase family protein [Cyanobacteriota bacterium]
MQSTQVSSAINTHRNDKLFSSRPDSVSLNTGRPTNNDIHEAPKLVLGNPPEDANKIGQETRNKAIKEMKFNFMDIFKPHQAFMKLVNKLLYQPQKIHPLNLAMKFQELKNAGLPMEDQFIKTKDDQYIRMWFAQNSKANAMTKIYFHGNAGDITSFTDQAIQDYQDGYNVCMASYRGYSGTNGIPTEQGLINDGLAIFEELIDRRGIAAETIDIKAHSLGAAVAIHAIEQRNRERNPAYYKEMKNIKSIADLDKLIIERFNHLTLGSTFVSIKELARDKFKFIPNFIKQLLTKNIWDNKGKIRLLSNIKHIRFLHGDKDQVIPLRHGQELQQFVRGLGMPSEIIIAEGADHDNVSATLSKQGKLYAIKALIPYQGHYNHITNPLSHSEKYAAEHAVDVCTPIGSPISAMRDGTVIDVQDQFEEHPQDFRAEADEKILEKLSQKTNYILIKGEDGLIQTYLHVQQASSKVKVGDKVKAGQEICSSGHNGATTEPHIHLEISIEDESAPNDKVSLPIQFTTTL